jgi:hypothetical protein
MKESIYNMIFLLSAVIFNLMIVVIYQYMRLDRLDVVKKFGIPLILLIIPFSIVLYEFIKAEKSLNIILGIVLVIAYLIIEFLLDQVFEYDFRSKLIPHILYIIVFYMALISLIVVAFDISKTYGYTVSVSFWILLISLITMLVSGKTNN